MIIYMRYVDNKFSMHKYMQTCLNSVELVKDIICKISLAALHYHAMGYFFGCGYSAGIPYEYCTLMYP